MHIAVPLSKNDIGRLFAGMSITLSGTVYTARDAAHARLAAMIDRGEALPFPVKDSGIYYAGPCPAQPGHIIGSCGPTTSSRMDAFAPSLYDLGLSFVIGKGPVSFKVRSAIVRNRSVYFAAVGGAGALIASHITDARVIAFEDLGTEAIRLITFDRVPLIVAIDSRGKCVYDRGANQTKPRLNT